MADQARDVVILSGVRTAIGTFGGALKDTPPSALGAACAREAMSRADISPDAIGHVVIGNIIHTEPRDMYISRVVAVEAGVPAEAPALTVNRLCGSGLQAIVSAAQSIMLGDVDAALAGGAESMSRAPHAQLNSRSGTKMGDARMTDMMLGALNDPFGHGHMGITAENVAERYGLDRAEQDAFAVESHKRATAAIKEGRFKDQILPIEVKVRRDTVMFDTDEHVRTEVSDADMAKLKPAFKKDGTVTPGNASGINDGAAAVVLMEAGKAEREGKKPLARILGYAHAGVDPDYMGLGPIPAVRKLMERTGLSVDDFDVIESNEAFAAQACAVAKDLGFPAEKTNVNGGAIALGHPIGATGAILTVKTLYELERSGGKIGLITMCIGGGQGIAMAIEKL
ncbi:acetyl-CoA C-acetyltransferase [Rhodobium orientis]|uniref:Beta-ketothiolase n=1 Tax=Rhodobium orientis TaxID=34017 RepID=A0A327JP46_9HYPH|nr:acetyl-CoA C-acyltransferase family protein [Rhodobium orientis]MBB4302027.1 acetyl-CoA C-acetyltransferase [Rhodobium orientis]MBK5950264.1 acetyl-CoA acetyltransferase [Rhodobium orientis]RAI27143.1 acetyl-CoA acetyltransferase [Rhodobium orientis]